MINLNEELYRSIAFRTIEDVRQNLKDGANPNYNPRGTPPLFLALYENKMDIFYLLLEHPNIDINIQNVMGNTIFVECLSQNLDDICDKLIDNENIMLKTNSKGEYPLHLSISYQRNDLVKKILDKYPSLINAQDIMGNSPLVIASRMGDESMIKLILNYNPDISKENRLSKNALDYLERKSLTHLLNTQANIKQDTNADITKKVNETKNESERDNLSVIKKRRNK